MTHPEVHAFETKLMKEVWEPFNSDRLSEFYHPDVVGHHRQQTLAYKDLQNRLAWDRNNRGNQTFHITDIIAEDDKFSIRFIFTAVHAGGTQERDVEVIYFYHLRGDKLSAFWLLASVDFHYKQAA